MEMKKMNFDDVRKKLNVVKARSQREHYKPVIAAMVDAVNALIQAIEEHDCGCETQMAITEKIMAKPTTDFSDVIGSLGECCQDKKEE